MNNTIQVLFDRQKGFVAYVRPYDFGFGIKKLPLTGLPKEIRDEQSIDRLIQYFAYTYLIPEKGVDGEYNRVSVHLSLKGGGKSKIPFQPGLALGSVVRGTSLEQMEKYAESVAQSEMYEEQIRGAEQRIEQLELKKKERQKVVAQDATKKLGDGAEDALVLLYEEERKKISEFLRQLAKQLAESKTTDLKPFKGFQQAVETPIDMAATHMEIQDRGFDSLQYSSQYISTEENNEDIHSKATSSTRSHSASASASGGIGWISGGASASHAWSDAVAERVGQIKKEGKSEGILMITATATTRHVRCFPTLKYDERKLQAVLQAMTVPLTKEVKEAREKEYEAELALNSAKLEAEAKKAEAEEAGKKLEEAKEKRKVTRKALTDAKAKVTSAEANKKTAEQAKTVATAGGAVPANLADLERAVTEAEAEVTAAKLVADDAKTDDDDTQAKVTQAETAATNANTAAETAVANVKTKEQALNDAKAKVKEEEEKAKANPPAQTVDWDDRYGVSVVNGEKRIYLLTEAVLGGSFVALITFCKSDTSQQDSSSSRKESSSSTSASIEAKGAWWSASASFARSAGDFSQSEDDKVRSLASTKINIEVLAQGVIPSFLRHEIQSEIMKHVDMTPSKVEMTVQNEADAKEMIKAKGEDKLVAVEKRYIKLQEAQAKVLNTVRAVSMTAVKQNVHTLDSVMEAYESFAAKITSDSGCGIPVGFNYTILTQMDIMKELARIRAGKARTE